MKYRSLRRLNDPSSLPVTLAEFKAHARIDSEDEDQYLVSLLELATTYIEDATRRTFIFTRYEMRLDQFPAWELHLPRPPLAPLPPVEVEYVDNIGQVVTINPSLYQVDVAATPGMLYPAYNGQWPETLRDIEGAVRVRWWAGYGQGSADVPRKVRHLILMLANHWFVNREPSGVMPTGIQPLLAHISWGQYG